MFTFIQVRFPLLYAPSHGWVLRGCPANGAGLRGSDEKAESNGHRCSVYCLCKTGNRAENVNQQLEGIPCLSPRDIGPVVYVHSFVQLTGRLLCTRHQVSSCGCAGIGCAPCRKDVVQECHSSMSTTGQMSLCKSSLPKLVINQICIFGVISLLICLFSELM